MLTAPTRSNSAIGRDDVAASNTRRRTAGRGWDVALHDGLRRRGVDEQGRPRAVALGYGLGVPAGADVDGGRPAADI